MRNTFRFLDLPDELQQKIYDECDVYSRIRLDHVLKKKFQHKTCINNKLLLIAHALKHDATYVNNNSTFNKFLAKNSSDGSVRCLLDEYKINLDELNEFETFCMCLENKSVLSFVSVDKFNDEQIAKISYLLYNISTVMFQNIWMNESGRTLLKKTVFTNPYELRIFCFNLINFANLDLAKHIFSMDAQNTYEIDVSMMKNYILTTDCWKSFADRVSCLKVLIEIFDVPKDILQKMLKISVDTLAVDAFKFLKEHGV